MSSDQIHPLSWPRRLRLLALVLVFLLQLGIIWWLSDWRPAPVRTSAPAPVLLLTGPGPNWVTLLDPAVFGPPGTNLSRITNFTWTTLMDPTLFARPHEQAFSGQAWMAAPAQEFAPLTWSEPPEWLALSVEDLGAAFHEFIASQPFDSQKWLPQPEPPLGLPPLPPARLFPDKSFLRLDGQLARRDLMTQPDLPSWPSSDVLSNSIVQVLVDGDGRPVSATLLPPGSGSREADERALTLARGARFRPAPNIDPNHPLAGIDFGQMIFVWHIVPQPQTNATAPK